MKLGGVKPANKSSYFQNVKLAGVKADPNTKLMAGKIAADAYQFGRDFVATTGAQTANISVSADLIFVGYGIDAPLYNWNDYKKNRTFDVLTKPDIFICYQHKKTCCSHKKKGLGDRRSLLR